MIPEPFVKYLKSYDLEKVGLDSEQGVYLVAIEVLCKGNTADKNSFYIMFPQDTLRKLFVAHGGECLDEQQREIIRNELNIDVSDLPHRFTVGW